MSVQEVRWDKVGTVRAGFVIFSMKKESKSSLWNRIFFVHHRIVSEFESVRGVHSAHIEYAIKVTDSKYEFITTDLTTV